MLQACAPAPLLASKPLRNEHSAVGGHSLFRAVVVHGTHQRTPRGRHREVQRIGPAGEEIDACDPPRQRGGVQERVQAREIFMTWQGGEAAAASEKLLGHEHRGGHSHVLQGGEKKEAVSERVVIGQVVEGRSGVVQVQRTEEDRVESFETGDFGFEDAC